MEIQVLQDTLSAFGIPGMIAVLVILLLVGLAKKSGIVATGNQARLANIVLSAILFGLGSDPSAETALMTAIASVLAGLAFELVKYAGNRIPKG